MPAYWSKKDERQYAHILTSCKRSRKVCKRIAAATVNKQRRVEGRTLSGYYGSMRHRPGTAPAWGREENKAVIVIGALGLGAVLLQSLAAAGAKAAAEHAAGK